MGKKSIFSIIVLVILLAVCLVACVATEDKEKDPDPVAVSIAVDESSIPQSVYAGDVDVTLFRLNITFDNGETQTVGMTSGMIATADRNKLNIVGTHQIQVVYSNLTTRFQITLKQKEANKYTLQIYGGKPVQINDVDIKDDIVVEGEFYEGIYEEGTTVTVEWIATNGYYFVRWTDNGAFVDSQSRTKVIMNTSHVYRAYSAAVINTVNFTTNCDTGIAARRTNTLYESDVPTLIRDGYVFDGWTTTPVTGDAAIDCTAPKITFPYAVNLETRLYGTWRELGIEYVDYVNQKTNTAGYKVAVYNKNDKEVVIPSTHNALPVIAIAADAFINAAALERLVIPSSVEEIDAGFVRNCGRLTQINVDGASRYFTSDDGILLNVSADELIAYPAGKLNAVYNVDGVRIIRDYAFNNAVLGGINLPAGLREVGNYAFNSVHLDYVNFEQVDPRLSGFSLGRELFNENLSHILIGVGSETENMFKNYESMRINSDKFTTDQSALPTIGINADKTVIYKTIVNEYSENDGLTAEVIGANRSMTSFLLPINLTYAVSSIGVKAFNGCIYLNSFTIPNETRLERILDGAFDGTPYLDGLANHTIIANNILYRYYGNAETFVLPRTVTGIAENAFRGNVNLKRLDLSDNNSLRYIGAFAFYGCTALESDESGVNFTLENNLERISPYAFAYTGLRRISLSPTGNSQLASIGKGAFSHCYYLVSAAIGALTREISADAFLYCYSLLEYIVQSGNPYFYSFDGILYAKIFSDNYQLFSYPSGKMAAEFNVGEPAGNKISVTSIGDYAFFMSNVASIYIPADVIDISASAFYTPGLISVRFQRLNNGITYSDLFIKDADGYGKTAPEYVTVTDIDLDANAELNLNAFFGNNNNLKTEKYRANTQTNFEISDGFVIRLEENYATVVRALRNAEELSIPGRVSGKNVTIVSSYAIAGYYLKKITLGNNLTTLQSKAMSLAKNLNHLYTISGMTVPNISEDSFSELFDNGLFIYVSSAQIESYISGWNLADDSYVINLAKLYPEARFTYRAGEEAEEIDPILREIAKDAVPIPTRQGYTFGGWRDIYGNLIDFENTYVIPYNITLVCHWLPMEYTVNFIIGNTATMTGDTTVKVEYGSSYEFEEPIYINKSKKLIGWRTVDNVQIDSRGEWDYLGASVINLYPVWQEVVYTLVFDTSDEGVVTSGSKATVTYGAYGEDFKIEIPAKEGYVFRGWSLSPDEDAELITDASGYGLLPWEYNDSEEYVIYSKWVVRTDIIVNLYFNKDTIYRTISVVFGEEFTFAYDTQYIQEEEWIKKAGLFCGWYDGFDEAAQSGTGMRYTDEEGVGLFRWNKGTETNLYAQWPLEISSGEELANLSDMSRSVVLTQDINVIKPIGSSSNPYTGTFNGGGCTVTFKYNGDAADGYIGLFAYNRGTIKNLILNAEIVVDSQNYSGSDIYVGAIAGVNEGKIISETGVNYGVVATIKVDVGTLVGHAHVGGYAGANVNGSVTNVKMEVRKLEILIGGAPYDKAAHGSILSCGIIVGTLNGGNLTSSEGVSYFYVSDDDPFKGAKCGDDKQNAVFLIGVTNTKVQ